MIAIGVDIGGTSIKGGAVNEKGEVLDTFSMPIIPNEHQDATMDKLVQIIKDFVGSHQFNEPITGLGFGIPGLIDSSKGEITYSDNLNWKHLQIVERLKKDFHLPILITNDANAAALGEAYFGFGPKYQNMIMITLGTGVGSGIIINGHIYDGVEGKGAEIGHTTLVLDGEPCPCGRRGCFEQYASANGLIRQTLKAMEKDKNSLLYDEAKKEGKVNGKVPFAAAKRGDKTAIAVVDQYIKYLGEGLLNICNTFRPECIVLSGGVANQGDYLVKRLTEYCEGRNYGYPHAPKTEIKIASVGYYSGIIGAASLILTK